MIAVHKKKILRLYLRNSLPRHLQRVNSNSQFGTITDNPFAEMQDWLRMQFFSSLKKHMPER